MSWPERTQKHRSYTLDQLRFWKGLSNLWLSILENSTSFRHCSLNLGSSLIPQSFALSFILLLPHPLFPRGTLTTHIFPFSLSPASCSFSVKYSFTVPVLSPLPPPLPTHPSLPVQQSSASHPLQQYLLTTLSPFQQFSNWICLVSFVFSTNFLWWKLRAESTTHWRNIVLGSSDSNFDSLNEKDLQTTMFIGQPILHSNLSLWCPIPQPGSCPGGPQWAQPASTSSLQRNWSFTFFDLFKFCFGELAWEHLHLLFVR